MRLSSWLRSAPLAKWAAPTRLGIESLEDRTVPSTFTVSNLADSGAGSLRAAIAAANTNSGADLIRFASSARDGTITLTSGELGITDALTIDGPGANRLAVSGNDASRVFNIASGATVSIDDLAITHGYSLLRGGGILNDGNLTVTRTVVSNNQVFGLPGVGSAVDPFGGGILNRGTLAVSYTSFVHNRSTGADGVPGGPGSTALGGALMSIGTADAPASATVTHSSFIDNEAVGGAAGVGSPFTRSGIGGAIMNDAGTMTVSNSLFQNNRAVGGAGGGATSFGAGGAIANVALAGSASLSVSNSTLIGNHAIGGVTGNGSAPQIGRGGAIANFIPGVAPIPVTVSATTTITNSTILGNEAVGGAGYIAGNGQGGGITNENGGVLTVSNSLIALNRAVGGASDGGTAGNGLGGGVFNGAQNPLGTPNLTLNRDLVSLNRAEGGAAGAGGTAGSGVGGGLYIAPGGIASSDLTPILLNCASTSDNNVFGLLI